MHGAGVLKARGAFLPMDPNYPEERLAYMVKDAAAPVLLTPVQTGQWFHKGIMVMWIDTLRPSGMKHAQLIVMGCQIELSMHMQNA